MKKTGFSFISILALLLYFTPYAQHSAKTTNKSLLWQISGNNLKKPSYLFGTIHLICPGDYVWTEQMKNSLKKSDEVCFEMNLNDPGVMMKVATGLADNSGKRLEDYFTPEQYKIVAQYVKDSIGMDIAMFQQMKPVALESVFTSKSTNCPNPVSYEENIMEIAKKDKKKIAGLESPDEQIAVLESIPADTVVKEILGDIQNNGKDDTDYDALLVAYKNQDLPALYSLITRTKALGDDMGLFLDKRNQKWIGRMARNMEKNSVFFAVGAGHLWGKEGLITLLRKKGYTVTPLK